jgi:hypothetical protein
MVATWKISVSYRK